jgi:hypothetical protein
MRITGLWTLNGAVDAQAEAQYQQAAPRAKDLLISAARPDDRSPKQVWASDIAYIRCGKDFCIWLRSSTAAGLS